MRLTIVCVVSWVLATFSTVFYAPYASAGETVTFPSPLIMPSPFKIRRAAAQGIVLEPTPGIELIGELFRPEGDGPHPAVVLLLSGDGLQASHLSWGQTFMESGYVALIVDSFRSRGITNVTDTPTRGADAIMDDDAFSAYAYLSGLDYVSPDRIGIVGFSIGGSGLLWTINSANGGIPESFRPNATVALYPVCQPAGELIAPLLILAGDNDQMMSLRICQAFVDQTTGQTHPVSIHVYPGATHFFDNPEYTRDEQGEILAAPPPLWFEDNEYNQAFHVDAIRRAIEFLEQ